MSERCDVCGRDVRTVESVYNRRIDVLANPSTAGNVALDSHGVARVYGTGEAENAIARGEKLYIQHAAAHRMLADSRRRRRAGTTEPDDVSNSSVQTHASRRSSAPSGSAMRKTA